MPDQGRKGQPDIATVSPSGGRHAVFFTSSVDQQDDFALSGVFLQNCLHLSKVANPLTVRLYSPDTHRYFHSFPSLPAQS